MRLLLFFPNLDAKVQRDEATVLKAHGPPVMQPQDWPDGLWQNRH